MNDDGARPFSGLFPPGSPISEADLHAYVDGQLAAARRGEVEAFLAGRPQAAGRVAAWQAQRRALHGLLDPVLDEPVPLRLALPRRERRAGPAWPRLATAACLLLAGFGSAWFLRGAIDGAAPRDAATLAAGPAEPFFQRAAVAHAVYTPDRGRPVEIGGDQEALLARWLSRRLGAEVRVPQLAGLGYELVGGRLLPGGTGPVAQFMYADAAGQRLTLYVTREAAGARTAFRFVREGGINVFYWVDERFGYALSGAAGRDEMLRLSESVYRQLQ